jgi:hypothetical protein
MGLRLYSVHLGRGDAAEDAVLVKEGFCWPALLFGPFWAFYHRLWLWGVAWIAVAMAAGLAEEALPAAAGYLGFATIALELLFAAEANDLRRVDLARRGWREVEVVGGTDDDTAARRFLDLQAIGR